MKIGVFDSGIGGLTVLKELIKAYPNNEYIYYGDTLNIPYGTKTKEELKERADKIINFFKNKKVDLIVIACGTVSSNLYETIKDEYDIPLYDVLSPTLNYIKDHNLKHVGVLATPMTIKSKAFINLDKMVASPLLVPIIENGKINTKECDEAVLAYLKDLEGCENIVLGCTHYPLLEKVIKKYSGANLINMGECVVKYLNLTNKGEAKVTLYFSLVTDLLKTQVFNILNNEYEIETKIL